MANPTLMAFGPFVLRKSVQRSRILDLWRGEMNDMTRTVPCLVRRLLPPYSQSDDFVKPFVARYQEISTRALPGKHPLLEQGVTEDIPYIVLEDANGWNLQELIHFFAQGETQLTPEVVFQFLLPVAKTLAAAHTPENPIVHGTVRPRSIWISPEGLVTLGDFEIGRLAEIELTSLEGQEERAWRFLAPEREDDWVNPAPSVDTFSWSSLAIELLIQGRLSMVQSRLDPLEQLPLLKEGGLPNKLLSLIERCQSEVPEERPSMSQVVKIVEAVAAALPTPEPLSAFLKSQAPPIEILDPLKKAPTPEDRIIVDRLRRQQKKRASTAATKTEMESQAGAEPGRAGNSGSTLTKLGALLLIGLIIGGVYFRKEIRKFVLGPGADMALVVVETVPDGAIVELTDGRTIGTTPLKVPLTIGPDGKIGLTIRKRDWRTIGPVFKEVKPREEVHLTYILEPQEHGPADANIVTKPDGARIDVDGEYRGTSPLEVKGLNSADEHRVEASLAGYQPASRTFVVEVDRLTEIKLELERDLNASSRRSGKRAVATQKSDQRPPKNQPRIKDVEAPAANEKITGPAGYLVCQSIPWSYISVDGKPRGKSGAHHKIKLSVGSHTVVFRRYDTNERIARTITIRQDDVKSLEYDFLNKGWKFAPYSPFE